MICCSAVYTFGTTGIVNTDTLRLREKNTTDSSIVKLLSVDDEVEIITKTDNGWYKVKYKDIQENKEYEGYVNEKYLKVNEDETIQSEENETLEEENNSIENPQEEVGTQEKIDESTIKVINKGEIIYTIPLVNSSTIKVLEKDEKVSVLTEMNGWSYISSENLERWVRTSKLKDVNASKKIGYIISNSVNFRKQPNTNGDVISKLSKNKEIVILEETNGWKKIEVDDNIGYVSAEYVSDKKVEVTSRSSTYRTAKKTKTTSKATLSKSTTTYSIEESSNVPANPNGNEIVAFAKQFVGYKYVYGGCTPSGFDCSGFTQYVYKNFGYSLSRSSSAQASNGVGVSKSSLQPGDIICFSGSSSSKKVTHVGLYIGNGKFVHAANARKGVIISNVDGDGFYYVCARRIK